MAEKYTNLDINSIRSMTVEDINNKIDLDPADLGEPTRYAYYPKNTAKEMVGEEEYNNKKYTRVKHNSLYSGITDYKFLKGADGVDGGGEEYIENGITYLRPTDEKPVYVTETFYTYNPKTTSYAKAKENQQKVSDILGSSYGWLASPCVYCGADYAYFDVRYASGSSVISNSLFDSDGNSHSLSNGVRPLVSLSSGLLELAP